ACGRCEGRCGMQTWIGNSESNLEVFIPFLGKYHRLVSGRCCQTCTPRSWPWGSCLVPGSQDSGILECPRGSLDASTWMLGCSALPHSLPRVQDAASGREPGSRGDEGFWQRWKEEICRVLGEIQAPLSPLLLRWLCHWLLPKLLSRVFLSVQLHRGQLEMVLRAARTVPLVFLCSHRSWVDGPLLSFVLLSQGIGVPRVTAGACSSPLAFPAGITSSLPQSSIPCRNHAPLSLTAPFSEGITLLSPLQLHSQQESSSVPQVVLLPRLMRDFSELLEQLLLRGQAVGFSGQLRALVGHSLRQLQLSPGSPRAALGAPEPLARALLGRLVLPILGPPSSLGRIVLSRDELLRKILELLQLLPPTLLGLQVGTRGWPVILHPAGAPGGDTGGLSPFSCAPSPASPLTVTAWESWTSSSLGGCWRRRRWVTFRDLSWGTGTGWL
uniref:Glycerol-3-phosphate acyltransferase 2, mitochondrial n=1 Tax=Malurus cyaneus samueli TaxID=2593467 RepID=A0A8C5TA56_9PASS